LKRQSIFLKKPVVYFCGHVSREIKSVKVWLGNIQPVSALVTGIIIAFLNQAEYKPRIDYGYNGTSPSTSTYVDNKSCSACGRSVSLAASAGQRCPHCGVYWSTERRING
jgi:hypothetical protein